jgi:hypothetical protein
VVASHLFTSVSMYIHSHVLGYPVCHARRGMLVSLVWHMRVEAVMHVAACSSVCHARRGMLVSVNTFSPWDPVSYHVHRAVLVVVPRLVLRGLVVVPRLVLRGLVSSHVLPARCLCVCGCVAVWLCGCVAVWLCGCVAVWLCGCVAMFALVMVALVMVALVMSPVVSSVVFSVVSCLLVFLSLCPLVFVSSSVSLFLSVSLSFSSLCFRFSGSVFLLCSFCLVSIFAGHSHSPKWPFSLNLPTTNRRNFVL